MSSLVKNLLLALALALVVWLGYIFFLKDDGTKGGPATTSQAELEAKEFLAKLQQLSSVKVDDTLFTDSRFHILTDYRQRLIPEEVGRENPFAPIE